MQNENEGYLRTMDGVQRTMELASIKDAELNNITQVVYSMPNTNTDRSIKLLELDEHLIETISKGDSLTFQGNDQDPVVLCTKNRTYDIKEAETSNSCLLLPNLKYSSKTNAKTAERTLEELNVSGIFHTYYEVKECKPKLGKLLSLLEQSSFKGVEYESSIDTEVLYNWDKLQNEVQASEDELKQAIKDYLIVNIDGYFRLTSFECEARSLTLMLDFFEENSWELDKVDREITYEALKELILKPVFDVLFEKYAEPSGKLKHDGTPLYRYNEEKCCKILAKVLLAASPVTDYKQFMESWSIGSPERMEPRKEYLNGIALVKWNNATMTKEVVSFPETNLPNGIIERFNELFKAKDKWTVPEITPYILNLTTNKIDANALLTKYARCSIVNNVKYYSSKHGK